MRNGVGGGSREFGILRHTPAYFGMPKDISSVEEVPMGANFPIFRSKEASRLRVPPANKCRVSTNTGGPPYQRETIPVSLGKLEQHKPLETSLLMALYRKKDLFCSVNKRLYSITKKN
ncbi:hypothetical protein RRG08_040380 [Elysia crispata]|uniref:Uncharacterized protein n=1 Tax=Elysia crispata TaxID=231223 RepID=A0AAE1DR45_9GAST|nr:hypothetical protein RRG08_040380 [Elysia crispata]